MKISKLKHTRRVMKQRRDRVKQHYWVGRRIRSRFGKNLGYRQLKQRGWKGRPYADTDGDRKVNTFDCRPLNPMRQDSKKTIKYADSLLGISANLYGYDFNLRDDVEWDDVKGSILSAFEKKYKVQISNGLSKLGLKLVGFNYYSPHAYNYEGDSIDTLIQIVNKEKLRRAILSNKTKIQNTLDKNKSYDGYMATTVRTVEEELDKLKSSDYEPDILVLGTLLDIRIDKEDFTYMILEEVGQYEEYD